MVTNQKRVTLKQCVAKMFERLSRDCLLWGPSPRHKRQQKGTGPHFKIQPLPNGIWLAVGSWSSWLSGSENQTSLLSEGNHGQYEGEKERIDPKIHRKLTQGHYFAQDGRKEMNQRTQSREVIWAINGWDERWIDMSNTKLHLSALVKRKLQSRRCNERMNAKLYLYMDRECVSKFLCRRTLIWETLNLV